MDAGTLLTLLLGGGGVALVGAVFTLIKYLSEGARSKEKEALARISQWTEDSEARADREQSRAQLAENRGAAWASYAARLEYVILRSGSDLPAKPTALRVLEELPDE